MPLLEKEEREVGQSLFLQIFKTQLAKSLRNTIYLRADPALGKGVGLEASWDPFQPELSSNTRLANERTDSEEVIGSEQTLQKDYIYFSLFKNY